MKILQVIHNWTYYNEIFNRKFPIDELSWPEILESYIQDGFNMGHIISPELSSRQYNSTFIIANNKRTQERWSQLHGSVSRNEIEILINQVEEFDPEVIYITDPVAINKDFVRFLKIKHKFIVAWRAAPIPSDVDFSYYDMFLTSDLKLAPIIKSAGCKTVKFHLPGHRQIVPRRDNKPADECLVFSGSYGSVHLRRNSLLAQLAILQLVSNYDFNLRYHLASSDIASLPVAIYMHYREPLFGRDLLELYSRSLATFHFPIDIAESNSTAMRMFEATGQGCLMFVHTNAELFDMFAEDEIVRFSDATDLVKKFCLLRDDYSLVQEIVNRAATTCHTRHSMETRALEFLEKIGNP